MKRKASAVWEGGLKDGKGTISADSGVLTNTPYSFSKRFEDEKGTTRRLTRDEILTYVFVIAGAGNETTTRLIGWAGKVLAETVQPLPVRPAA